MQTDTHMTMPYNSAEILILVRSITKKNQQIVKWKLDGSKGRTRRKSGERNNDTQKIANNDENREPNGKGRKNNTKSYDNINHGKNLGSNNSGTKTKARDNIDIKTGIETKARDNIGKVKESSKNEGHKAKENIERNAGKYIDKKITLEPVDVDPDNPNPAVISTTKCSPCMGRGETHG